MPRTSFGSFRQNSMTGCTSQNWREKMFLSMLEAFTWHGFIKKGKKKKKIHTYIYIYICIGQKKPWRLEDETMHGAPS